MKSFNHYLGEYLETSLAQGINLRTVENRSHTLNRFFLWCAERNLNHPHEITYPMLERYQRHLYHYRQKNGKPLSLATQRNRLTPIKLFFKWLTRERHILYNPASELQLPRKHKTLPKAILTHDEVEIILKRALHNEHGLRDRAILETFYATGIRRTELANLKLDDIELDQHTMMIRQGKGKKDRLIPINENACTWINRYLLEQRPQLVSLDTQHLFLNDRGEAYKPHQLSELVKRRLQQAGIKKEGACHLFRHTLATMMMDNGADIRFIQAMLGHADISTTQVYTHVAIRQLKEVYLRTHPGNPTVQKATDET